MAYDWKTGLTSGIAGAGTGSTFGPVGTAAGGLFGLLSGFFGSGKEKMKKVPTMSKDQLALLSRIEQMINPQGSLGQGYEGAIDYQKQLMDPSSEAVQQFTQPYIDQFNQQIVPRLAERFAGFGAEGGGLSSSGFGQSLSTAGSTLQNQLALLKAGLGQQAANSLMNQYGNQQQMALNAQPFGYQQPQQSTAQTTYNNWVAGGMPGMSSLQDMYNKYFPNGGR